MPAQFAVSGSTILSEPARFRELLDRGLGLEFGELPDLDAAERLAALAGERPWGLHAPPVRGGKKYFAPTDSIAPLQEAARWARARGGRYLLGHFPYPPHGEADLRAVATAAEPLHALPLPFVAELKLGTGPGGTTPGIFATPAADLLAALGGLPLCLDLGDAFLAARQLGRDPYQLMRRLAPVTRVVHVHTVRWPREEPYIWEPVHPSLRRPDYLDVERALDALAGQRGLIFVDEHTPQRAGPPGFAAEGWAWFEGLVRARRL